MPSEKSFTKNRTILDARRDPKLDAAKSKPESAGESGPGPKTYQGVGFRRFRFLEHQDDRTGRCQTKDYCAPRRGASGGIFFERSGLHLAGQLPAVDNCRSSSVGYRRQDELT